MERPELFDSVSPAFWTVVEHKAVVISFEVVAVSTQRAELAKREFAKSVALSRQQVLVKRLTMRLLDMSAKGNEILAPNY
jgi:hypothetical protein